mgnify:FL=1
MKKIISIIGSETFLHEDLKSMFQDISEKDLIVKSVNDGEIIADNKGTEIVIKFGKFNVENISNDFKTEVSEFRNVLRESVGLLKKQGLIDKTQLEKLASQFAFLGDAKTKETKASEQEPAKEAKRKEG